MRHPSHAKPNDTTPEWAQQCGATTNMNTGCASIHSSSAKLSSIKDSLEFKGNDNNTHSTLQVRRPSGISGVGIASDCMNNLSANIIWRPVTPWPSIMRGRCRDHHTGDMNLKIQLNINNGGSTFQARQMEGMLWNNTCSTLPCWVPPMISARVHNSSGAMPQCTKANP
jgi:hypothetical protein